MDLLCHLWNWRKILCNMDTGARQWAAQKGTSQNSKNSETPAKIPRSYSQDVSRAVVQWKRSKAELRNPETKFKWHTENTSGLESVLLICVEELSKSGKILKDTVRIVKGDSLPPRCLWLHRTTEEKPPSMRVEDRAQHPSTGAVIASDLLRCLTKLWARMWDHLLWIFSTCSIR